MADQDPTTAVRTASPLSLVHDLTIRSIAHNIALQQPENDTDAFAFAKSAARALGYMPDKIEEAATAAMQAWKELYGGDPVFEDPQIPHADYFAAARVHMLHGDNELATVYMLMAVYGALILPSFETSIGEEAARLRSTRRP